MGIAALYVQRAGVYSTLPGVECYDIDRDARTYGGPWPVVAHPPCRSWGKLAHMAKPRDDERQLAFHALEMVQRYGGVLEHPVGSRLFEEAGIPLSRLVQVDQVHWGHRARKASWLYLVGTHVWLSDLPARRQAVTTVERMCRQERERTPRPFAEFLVRLAERSEPKGGVAPPPAPRQQCLAL